MIIIVGTPETGTGELCIIGVEVSVDGSGVAVRINMVAGVTVGIVTCVSVIDIAVPMTTVGLVLVDVIKPLHDVKIIATINKGTIALLMIFTFPLPFMFESNRPTVCVTGWREEQDNTILTEVI